MRAKAKGKSKQLIEGNDQKIEEKRVNNPGDNTDDRNGCDSGKEWNKQNKQSRHPKAGRGL